MGAGFRTRVWLCAALFSASIACAAGDPATDRGPGSIQEQPTGGGVNNNGDSPAGEAGAGSFGNGNEQDLPEQLPPLPETGECPPGMRCQDPNSIDEDDCGKQVLETEIEVIVHPGNVLLVFDTSGSMAMDWNGQARWEAAGSAIEAALSPLTDLLTIGAVFFPRSDPNAMPVCVDPTGITCLLLPGLVVAPGTCGVTEIAATDQLNFTAGADFMSAFVGGQGAAPPYAPVPNGLTPLKEGLQQAQAALASSTLTGVTSVIVIPDGDPNCEWDQGVSLQIVQDGQAAGIDTHVLGLPGLSGMGTQVLTDLAAAGGTGTYITPTDSAALESKLREMAMVSFRAVFE
jgi:hypothetical protein